MTSQRDALIRHIICHHWHPLGVSGMVKAPGKYDSFVQGLCEVVGSGASSGELAKYLSGRGASSKKATSQQDELFAVVARKICALNTALNRT